MVVPLVTWAVYTLDRILDVRRDAENLQSDRHEFHRRHLKVLVSFISVSLLTAATVAIMEFPLSYWIMGAFLGALTCVHYLLHSARFPMVGLLKDCNVALTFSLSAWSIPLLLSVHNYTTAFGAVFVITSSSIIILIDVILLSLLEFDLDTQRGTSSIAVTFGRANSKKYIYILCIGALTSAILSHSLFNVDWQVEAVLLAMTLYYFGMTYVKFKSDTFARFAYEFGLLIPLLLLLFV